MDDMWCMKCSNLFHFYKSLRKWENFPIPKALRIFLFGFPYSRKILMWNPIFRKNTPHLCSPLLKCPLAPSPYFVPSPLTFKVVPRPSQKWGTLEKWNPSPLSTCRYRKPWQSDLRLDFGDVGLILANFWHFWPNVQPDDHKIHLIKIPNSHTAMSVLNIYTSS